MFKYIKRKFSLSLAENKFTSKKITQLINLIALIEGIIILSSKNLICDEEIRSKFFKEKKELTRLLSSGGTGITRYCSQKELRAISQLLKIGQKFISILYEEKLIGQTYTRDFSSLVNNFQKLENSSKMNYADSALTF